MNSFRDFLRKPAFWGLVAIAVMLVINLIKDSRYLAMSINQNNGVIMGNVVDILTTAAPIMMIAIGMAMVIATTGIDLSVGSVMAVSGATALQFLQGTADDSVGAVIAAVGLSMLVGILLGLVNGVFVAYVGLQPFITTLVMMMVGRGIAKVITENQNPGTTNPAYSWIYSGVFLGIPVVLFLAALVIAIVALVVRKTALGLMIESIGINPNASRLAGIRPKPLLITVYVVSALLASIGGIFLTASVSRVTVNTTGALMELDAILAVVIGGTSLAGGKFSIGGSVVGALVIATLNKTVLFLGVPPEATPAFKAIVIVILVALQAPMVRNLFRARTPRKPTPAAPPAAPEKAEVAA